MHCLRLPFEEVWISAPVNRPLLGIAIKVKDKAGQGDHESWHIEGRPTQQINTFLSTNKPHASRGPRLANVGLRNGGFMKQAAFKVSHKYPSFQGLQGFRRLPFTFQLARNPPRDHKQIQKKPSSLNMKSSTALAVLASAALSAAQSSTAVASSAAAAPTEVTECHLHGETPYCFAGEDEWELESDVGTLADAYTDCHAHDDGELYAFLSHATAISD